MTDNRENIVARLKEKIELYLPVEEGDFPTAIEGVQLYCRKTANQAENCIYKPLVAVVVQGSKRAVIGKVEYSYGQGDCMVSGVDLPSLSYVTEATAEKPLFLITLCLDSQLTSQLAATMPAEAHQKEQTSTGAVIMPAAPEVLGGFLRLMDLLDKPDQISVLAPIIIREIHYWLLDGPQGGHLCQVNTLGTLSNRISKSIVWLRENYIDPVDVEDMARNANMAPPTFRRHFRNITSLSPLQYQKHLRLYEAQRLLLMEGYDTAKAGYSVGYESLTQFNKEYKRLFGAPPRANVNLLR